MNEVCALRSTPAGRGPGATVAGDGTGRGCDSAPLDGPDGLLARARGGDTAAREALIERYVPFALKVASEVTGTYVELGRDDEASVALLAFNEAIDSYDPGRGASFLGFVRAVVRRRLIDDFRKKKSRRREVPVGSLADSDDGRGGTSGAAGAAVDATAGLEAAQVLAAETAHREWEERSERREEVLRYRELLASFGISLDELVRISPRHEDARRRAIEAARRLAESPELMDHLRRWKELPLKRLDRLTDVSRKTLERQRKYIIAVAIILTEDLPHLKEYLR